MTAFPFPASLSFFIYNTTTLQTNKNYSEVSLPVPLQYVIFFITGWTKEPRYHPILTSAPILLPTMHTAHENYSNLWCSMPPTVQCSTLSILMYNLAHISFFLQLLLSFLLSSASPFSPCLPPLDPVLSIFMLLPVLHTATLELWKLPWMLQGFELRTWALGLTTLWTKMK